MSSVRSGRLAPLMVVSPGESYQRRERRCGTTLGNYSRLRTGCDSAVRFTISARVALTRFSGVIMISCPQPPAPTPSLRRSR